MSAGLPLTAPQLLATLFPTAAASYTFVAVATDYRNISAASSPLVVARSAEPIPSVTLQAPSVLAVASALTFTALVSPACGGSTAAGSRTLTYEWTLTSGEGGAVTAFPTASSMLLLPPFSLPAGVTSTLTLNVTASSAGGPPLSNAVSTTLTPPLSPLQAVIAGGSERSAGVDEPLTLDAIGTAALQLAITPPSAISPLSAISSPSAPALPSVAAPSLLVVPL